MIIHISNFQITPQFIFSHFQSDLFPDFLYKCLEKKKKLNKQLKNNIK